jgi:hypothetical protein
MVLLQGVIERLAGMSLDNYADGHLFRPIGMSDTRFAPDTNDRAYRQRIARTTVDEIRGGPLQGVVHDANAWAMGGVSGHAGLFSTARDIAVFAQLMLDGGTYGSVRIVAPSPDALTLAIRDYADRMGMPSGFYTPDTEIGREAVDECATPGGPTYPIVTTPGRPAFVATSVRDVAISLYGAPGDVKVEGVVDLAIVGAGPAGLAAAVYGASEGLTTVVSTPYMDEATRCDRIALIHRGRLLGVDTPEAITRTFERPLFAVRAGDRYRALLALRKYEHAYSAYPFGDVIHYTDKRVGGSVDAIAGDIKTFLTASGVSDASVEPLTPTVEDSFIARTEDAA